jgi:hypothetical protein
MLSRRRVALIVGIVVLLIPSYAYLNEFYTHGNFPAPSSPATSASMRAEFDLISAGFAKLPPLAGNANKVVIINGGATGLTTTTGQLSLAGNFTITGAFNTIFAQQASTTLTLPGASGTLATWDGAEIFTNKILIAPSITAPSGLISADVGLGNVDNTSDATKNAAAATLTNKTVTAPIITGGTLSGTVLTIPDTLTITGSGDVTKKLAFEVDGLTPGTTRTITPPDANLTLPTITAAGDLPIGSSAGVLSTLHVGPNGSLLISQAANPLKLAYVAALNGMQYGNTFGPGDGAGGGDLINDVTLSAGGSLDVTNAYWMDGAAITKQLDAVWAAGTNAGGMDVAFPVSTITVTIASPAVVSWTAHGLTTGDTVMFSTTGTLPTGLSAGTVYCLISAGLTVDVFEVSTTCGGAAVNTSGSQNGVQTATGFYSRGYYLWRIGGTRSADVTIDIGSPALIHWTGHGLLTNNTVTFSTTVQLPTGLTVGTTYWITVNDANSFYVSDSYGGVSVNTSNFASGVQTATAPVIDALFSLSSTAPTMPANYNYKRLRGWVMRVAGTIVAFHTYETDGGGVDYLWDTPTLDINLANTLTTARRTDAVKVPTAFSTIAHLNAAMDDGAVVATGLLYCPDQTDLVPSTTAAPLVNIRTYVLGTVAIAALDIRTSATGTIAARVTSGTIDQYRVSTRGFTWDRRN